MSTPRLYWVGPDGQESVFLIASSEVLIGRKGDADVVLSNQHVSRHHAKIVMMPEGYFLQDLGSTHGTFVNNQQIEQHILKDGDRIALGKDRVELQYLVTDDLSTRAPAKPDTTQIFEKSLMNLGVVLPPEYSDLEKISCLLDFQYQWEQLFTPNAAFQKILEFALKISGAERGFILVREGTAFGYAAGLDGMGRTLTPSHFQTSQTVVNDVVAKGSPVFMVEGLDKKYIEQASIVAMNLRAHRNALGISQSRLARMSGVSRFKICTFELGSGSLTPDEQDQIRKALHAEAERLRSVPAQLDLGRFTSGALCAGSNHARQRNDQ